MGKGKGTGKEMNYARCLVIMPVHGKSNYQYQFINLRAEQAVQVNLLKADTSCDYILGMSSSLRHYLVETRDGNWKIPKNQRNSFKSWGVKDKVLVGYNDRGSAPTILINMTQNNYVEATPN